MDGNRHRMWKWWVLAYATHSLDIFLRGRLEEMHKNFQNTSYFRVWAPIRKIYKTVNIGPTGRFAESNTGIFTSSVCPKYSNYFLPRTRRVPFPFVPSLSLLSISFRRKWIVCTEALRGILYITAGTCLWHFLAISYSLSILLICVCNSLAQLFPINPK
jgi:hypothetical protein